jgi:transmembrane sensor
MNGSTPDDETLFREAMDLVIRLQNDPYNEISHDLIRLWRQRGPAYERVWQEARSLHTLAGKAVVARRSRNMPARRLMSRRNFLLGGGSICAAAALGAIYLPTAIVKARADFLTTTAELKQVVLPDGSNAMLGPDSAISINFSPQRRDVELLAGMVFFDVVKNIERPFQVERNGLTATALGTAFDMRDDAGVVSVSVVGGSVEIDMPASPTMDAIHLLEGEWLRFESDSRKLERGQNSIGKIAAWRKEMIVADGERISSVIAQIGRWYEGKILITSSLLGERRISGLFDLRQPLLALEAVVQPYGGKVRRLSPWLTVISTV